MTSVHTGTSQMHSYPTPSPDHSNMDEGIYANCRIEDLPCYHDITRNTAEILLLSNAEEGSFLIRPSTNKGNFGVSVRLANSVRHFQIDYNGQWFTFGQAQFWTPLEIWGHLQNGPVLECDEGIVVNLSRPYYNESKTVLPNPTVDQYSTIKRHYVQEEPPQPRIKRSTSNIILSKEGQLYKKKEGKNWKRRWFILNRNVLSFKKNEREKKARKVLDLGKAIQAHEYLDNTRENCFRILFRNDSYILSAESPEDRDLWLSSITWQIEAAQRNEQTNEA